MTVRGKIIKKLIKLSDEVNSGNFLATSQEKLAPELRRIEAERAKLERSWETRTQDARTDEIQL
jgi:hypothetical protein